MKKKVLFISLIWGSLSSALTLPEFLQSVEVSNQVIQSAKLKKSAAQSKKISTNIDLSPMLTFDYGYLNDQKATAIPAFLGTQTVANSYSLGLSKKTSTGTSFKASLSAIETQVEGTTPVTEDSAAGVLSFGISQSLWKNGFGKDISLRQQREDDLAKINELAAEMEIRNTLILAEKTYWNYLVLKEELKVRKNSIDRAQKLVNWMAKRVRDGIGEESDLTQVQALLEVRKLDLISAEDEFQSARMSVAEMLSLIEGAQIPDLEGDLSNLRSIPKIISDSQTGKVQVIRLDTKISELESKIKSTVFEEVENSLKPDLTLSANYATNSKEAELSDAVNNSSDSDKPTYSVGLQFAWIFDTESKRGLRSSTSQEKKSAELVWKQKQIQSENSWNELIRRHGELSKRITLIQKLSELRKSIAKSEESKLSRGRTITSNVITSVQDAEESELSLLKLKSEQRKLEADSKLFMVNQ